MVPVESCQELTTRFWASSARRARGTDAPGYYIGAYHYHKTTSAYLAQAADAEGPLDAVLDIPGEPLAVLRQGLSEALEKEGIEFRTARHEGREAGRAVLRSWHGQGDFALAPHEDEAQCSEPQQADFEIQRVVGYHVVGLNICLENGAGGRLGVWNVRPNDEDRLRLGVRYAGSPYPVEFLEGAEVMWIDINPGDVYLFNSAHIHAVEPETDVTAQRTTMSAMLGFIGERSVVSWT
jgi:hypothetical protein